MTKVTKWYAVRKGKNPGIYMTWADCEKQVKGFSGAEYKSFTSEAKAREYMNSDEQSMDSVVVQEEDLFTEGVLMAYTDGSFTAGDPPKSGYGICFVRDGKEIARVYGPCNADSSLRNVGGELMAAQKAIEIAQKLLEPELIICHDFKNIQMWGDGLWRCNIKETAEFRELVANARENGLTIEFGWVRGHAGNKYNELADQYACSGADGAVKDLVI